MSNRKVKAAKGNWKHVDGGMAFVIPVTLLKHPNWVRLRAPAVKLVLDLGRQYSGLNNGYLCAAWELMREQGWRSRETLALAISEAEHYRVIVKTLQGGKNRASRYAFTWWPIHHLANLPFGLESPATSAPSNAWKSEVLDFVTPDKVLRSRQNRIKKWEAKMKNDWPVKRAA